MKTTKLLLLFAAAGLMAAACEQAETEDQTVAVESVSLDEAISEGITITEGETYEIANFVTVLPENATDKTVTYSSSDTKKATVSEEGVITAVAEGTADITVTAGDKTATFTVTVKPKPAGTVPVESITLDESIAEGATLETGKTLDISSLITVLPENATDKSVKYSSSAEEYATVSDAGVITAVAAGEATITVTSASDAKVSASFKLTVTAAEPAGNITGITVSEEGKALTYTSEVRGTTDLAQYITTTPAEHTDGLTYSSSDEKVATVSEDGKLTIVAAGIATITVAAESNPDVKATITVTVNQYVGDYPRFEGDENDGQAAVTGENWYWTMTFSDELLTPDVEKLVNGRNNSLTAMLDGRTVATRGGTDDAALTNGTAFCVKNRGTAADHEAYFIIDMGRPQLVNYFRISNISTHKDDVRTRFYKFNKIEGSNDGNSFTSIETELNFKDVQAGIENRNSGNITIPESNYRYLKFTFKGTECFGPDGQAGATAQIEEFYLGYEDEAAE